MSFKTTCKEAHRLSSEGLDRELSMMERTRLRMHLLVCEACRTFTDQLQLLQRAMHQFLPSADEDKQNERE